MGKSSIFSLKSSRSHFQKTSSQVAVIFRKPQVKSQSFSENLKSSRSHFQKTSSQVAVIFRKPQVKSQSFSENLKSSRSHFQKTSSQVAVIFRKPQVKSSQVMHNSKKIQVELFSKTLKSKMDSTSPYLLEDVQYILVLQ